MRVRALALIVATLVLIGMAGCGGSDTGASVQDAIENESNLSAINLVSESQSGSASRLTELVVECELPKAEPIMVYKVKLANVDEAWVRDTAARLGLPSRSVDIEDGTFFLKGENGDLHVDRATGAIKLITPELNLASDPLKDVREDSYYQAAAVQFLKEKRLWPEGAVFWGMNKGNTVTLIDDDENETTYPVIMEALFLREDLGGIPWDGVGPKISVYFGEGGKIIGVYTLWREVEQYKEYPVIEAVEALENVKAGKAAVYNALQQAGVVRKVELVYMSDPLGYPQEFVAPYYKVVGVTADGTEFFAYTRALPDGLITETPAPTYAAPASPGSKE